MSMCVCGSGLKSSLCCEPLLAGKPAPTAEALLRARYAAYALGHIDYIERTCTPEALKEFDRVDVEQFSKNASWEGLEIQRVEGGGATDDAAEIEFVFHCTYEGKPFEQREIASFCRKSGVWLYKDSKVNPKGPPASVVQTGRNDPCPCGSKKKYKKCCGA